MNELHLDPTPAETSRFDSLYCGFLLTAGLALFLFIACNPSIREDEPRSARAEIAALE